MLAPAATGLGLPLLVTVRLQDIRTFVTTVVLLLFEVGSVVPEEATDEFCRFERHRLIAHGTIAAIILVAEGDPGFAHRDQPAMEMATRWV